MDYNWLENTPSVSGDFRNALPIWQPDYSFLQSMDMRINQQFDQGLQKIAGAYSLFHQPTTGTEAAQTQQEMAKQAQEQMKSVSAADISDPKNVLKAENILAPFWQNKDLLTNISKTKQISANIQKAYSVRDSTDEKIRDQFDDRYVQLLQYQHNNLANAPLSENKSVEIDDWIPFHKVINNLDKHREDDKFGIVQSFITGDGRIATSGNGATSLPAFKTYADSKLGSEYEAQYNLLGKLSKERQVSQLVQNGLDRKSAQREVGMQMIPDIMHSLESRTKEYSDLIGMNQAQLDKINTEVQRQKGIPTATQQYNIDRLNKEMEQYGSRQGEIDKQYKSLKDENGQSVIAHPEYWLGQQYRNDDINKWALGESGKTTMKYDKDEAFWSAATLRKDYYDIGQRTRHEKVMEGIDQQRANIEGYKADIELLKVKAEHPEAFGPDGKPLAGVGAGATYTGPATTQNQHVDNVGETNLHKAELHNSAVRSMWSPDGMMSILSNVPESVASPEEVLTFSREMSNALSGGKLSKNPETMYAYNKMSLFLRNQTGLDVNTPEQVNTAMLAYTDKYINDNTLNGGMGKVEKEKLRTTYNSIKGNVDAYQRDEEQRKALVSNLIKDPKNYNKYKDVIINGVVLNEQDMVKGAPATINLIDADHNSPKFGQKVPVASSDIAYQILHGDVKDLTSAAAGSSGVVSIGGRKYQIPRDTRGNTILGYKPGAVGGSHVPIYNTVTNQDAAAFHSTFGRYFTLNGKGTISNEGLKTKLNDLNNVVVPNTDLFKRNTGKVANQYTIEHTNPKAPLTKALKEDVRPGQFNQMYDRTKGENDHFLSGEEVAAVQEAIHEGKLEDYIGTQHIFYDQSFTGKPGNEITFGNLSSTDQKKIPPNIQKLSGRTIFIEQSDNRATYNTMYPKATDYSYDPLVKDGGTPEKSDPLLNTMNHASYTLIPSQGVVTVVGEIKTMDPHTGQEGVKKLWIPIPLSNKNPNIIRQTMIDSTGKYGAIYDQNLEYYNHHQHK